MSDYIDLLIANNDLVLDASQQPLLVEDRASIAQDIAHMIRDSGLLGTLLAYVFCRVREARTPWRGFASRRWPLLLAVVGLLLNFLLALLERRFTYWRRGLRHGG